MASKSPTQQDRKRRRTSPSAAGDIDHITHLPDNLLVEVASYLTKTSRALFAGALTASSTSWQRCNWKCQPSATSRAVLQQSGDPDDQWDTLDFLDIEKTLRIKLSDGDIGAILVCIDGLNKLHRLKLTHCFNVSGTGLEPLRGSVVLEQADLSLVEQNESPFIDSEILLVWDATIPILDSIVDTEGNSLKHIQFTRKWHFSRTEAYHQFLTKCNRMYEDKTICCSKCDDMIFDPTSPSKWFRDKQNRPEMYGQQWWTCSKCLKSFCEDDVSEHENDHLAFCHRCCRHQCQDCVKSTWCYYCDDHVCEVCRECNHCLECDTAYCIEHIQTCQSCNIGPCPVCSNGENDEIVECNHCGKSFCFSCRRVECRKDWTRCCSGCLRLIAPRLDRGFSD